MRIRWNQLTGQGRIGFGDEAAHDLPRHDIRQKQQTSALVRFSSVKQAEIPAALCPQPHLAEVGIAIIRAEQKATEAGMLCKANDIRQ
jgi:hypothetical protein